MRRNSRKLFLVFGITALIIAGLLILIYPTHRTSLPFLADSPIIWQESTLTGPSARPSNPRNQFWPDSVATWSEGKRTVAKPPILDPRLGGNTTVRHTMYRFTGNENEILGAIHEIDPKALGWVGEESGAGPGFKMVSVNLGARRSVTLQWRPSSQPGTIDIVVDEWADTTPFDRLEAFVRGGYFHPSHALP